MSKGPGLFSDIGKKAKDVLTRDYITDHKLTVSTTSDSGVGITSAAVKKGGVYAFDVGTQYKYKNTLIDVKVDTDSNISTTITVTDILPSTKTIASLKFPDYNAGKVEVQYFHHHASVASVVALKQTPVVDLSAAVGANGVVFGAEAGFDTASGTFTKYNAAVGVTKPDYNVTITLADKGDTLRGTYMYYTDAKKQSAAVTEISRRISTRENTYTFGSTYAVDPQTTVKTKVNHAGKVSAVLQHELKPKSFLTISGELDTKAVDKIPKFGFALALKP